MMLQHVVLGMPLLVDLVYLSSQKDQIFSVIFNVIRKKKLGKPNFVQKAMQLLLKNKCIYYPMYFSGIFPCTFNNYVTTIHNH